MVTFSFSGCSTISIPNLDFNTLCAPSNTVLNCLDPCSPNTFKVISFRLITCREYSLASASRTSFLIIKSVPLRACVPSAWLS
jgi:hypothetical protein